MDQYQYALVNDALDEAASEMRAVVRTERGEASVAEQASARRCLTEAKSGHLQAALGSFAVELVASH